MISVTIYGPLEILEEIGEWLAQHDIYLQDPTTCHFDARYCNPHRLSYINVESCPLVSQVVSQSTKVLHFQDIPDQPDFLDIISGQNDLKETRPHDFILATLHKHQKQALTFMLQRELGWGSLEDLPDLWEAHDSTYERVFINRINNIHQDEPPPQFNGGIIADPMGLGKTLTMIALVASDFSNPLNDDAWRSTEDERPYANCTLIIVPQPLLAGWEQQISDHVRRDCIRHCRHHGKDRLGSFDEISRFNIILTTYHTLSADWKSNDEMRRIIFAVRWRRIILDEAHLIRNMKTQMARALCDIEALSRWAVTGTPIQNNLGDLSGLLKFIRAYPYNDPKKFDADFTNLWKAQEAEKAVKRLKYLASCLILRRPKKAINLPKRHDVRCPVEFTKDERKLYESVRHQTITKIEDALANDTEITRSGIYVNFLQQIESMRLVCNLGLRYHLRHDSTVSQEVVDWTAVAQDAFNIQREMAVMVCSQCSSFLDQNTYTWEDGHTSQNPCYSRCLQYACADCSSRIHQAGARMVCGHTPRCPIAFVSLDGSASEDSQHRTFQLNHPSLSTPLPAKVKALSADLGGLSSSVKSIVFSTWRLTLDVVEAGLREAGIRAVRFDGKVPQAQRQPILDKFKRDPSVRVLLLTLQCGAVGLTLTEASRAYLMEPHWNPTVEEQALARIHRIGQTREVTTVRFYIRDSFEEKIMETQDSKKNLANILLSSHDGGHADDSLGALQVCFQRVEI